MRAGEVRCEEGRQERHSMNRLERTCEVREEGTEGGRIYYTH